MTRQTKEEALLGFLLGMIAGVVGYNAIAHLLLPQHGPTPELLPASFQIAAMLACALGGGLVGFIGCGYHHWFYAYPPRWLRIAGLMVLVLWFLAFNSWCIAALLRERQRHVPAFTISQQHRT